MNATRTREVDLPDLQARRLPRLTWQMMLTGQVSLSDACAMARYFRHFAAPSAKCLGCGDELNGPLGLWGTLRWGIAHGEARCSVCGYPYRVYHRDVGPIGFINHILPYHPDDLTNRSAA